jgi:hypothetical protein
MSVKGFSQPSKVRAPIVFRKPVRMATQAASAGETPLSHTLVASRFESIPIAFVTL